MRFEKEFGDHFFFFPFFFFFFTTKNGFDNRHVGYSTFSIFSSSPIYSGCIRPFFIACIEVKIFCLANFILMSQISSRNSSRLFTRRFYSRIAEKGFGLDEEAATVLTLRRLKQESPSSVLRLSLLISLLRCDRPSLMAQLILVLQRASQTFLGSFTVEISLKARIDCIFLLISVFSRDFFEAQSIMQFLRLSSSRWICYLQLLFNRQR